MKILMVLVGALIVVALLIGLKGRSEQQATSATVSPTSTATESSTTSPGVNGSPSPVATSTGQQTANHDVSLSEVGYSPKTLSVKLGETVKFTNMGSSPHKVASDPHPTHTDYPSLVSPELAPGESWVFTFDKAGTWGVHDHLNPSFKMSVTVQ